MKPYDASLCMKCEAAEPAFGSFFCLACTAELMSARKTEPQVQPNNRVRPPSRIGTVPKKG